MLRTWIQRFVACGALAVCALPSMGAGAGVRDVGDSMVEALSKMVVASDAMDRTTNYGYANGVCVMGAYLTRGGEVRMQMSGTVGKRYLLIAGGDRLAKDVDVEILDPATGQLIRADVDADASAAAAFVVPASGKFTVKLKLYDTSGSGSFVAASLLMEGGYSVPVARAAEAGDHLMEVIRGSVDGLQKKGLTASFQSSPNQWALYGSVLKTDQESRVFNLNPGLGTQVFVSAADSLATDLDLVVDPNDPARELAKDIEDDDYAVVLARTVARQSYGVTTRMAKTVNDRQSLTLTAVLSAR